MKNSIRAHGKLNMRRACCGKMDAIYKIKESAKGGKKKEDTQAKLKEGDLLLFLHWEDVSMLSKNFNTENLHTDGRTSKVPARSLKRR